MAPIISLPADTDGASWAQIYQAHKTAADYLALLSKSSRPSLPVVPASGSAYTAVTYSSFGGTVTPTGAGFNVGRYYVIKIIVGGAVGVATFQTSLDGGNTYGATQTTAASMTDATGGETLAFAGTLTINGTAAFQGAFTPQSERIDQGGNIRHLIDHNGYPLGRRSEFREEWIGSLTNYNTGGIIANLPRWFLTTSGAGNQVSTGVFGTLDASPFIQLNPTTTNGNVLTLSTAIPLVKLQTFLSLVAEFEAFSLAATGNQTLAIGFSDTRDITTAANWIWLTKTNASANWFASTGVGSVAGTPVDTTVAVANTSQRLKMEYHGSASPLGAATARFWVNEGSPISITASLPAVATTLYFVLGVQNTGTSSNGFLVVGPLLETFNRWLSLPAL